MKAERRSERLALSISAGLKAHLEKLYSEDNKPHCGWVHPADSLAEYAALLLEECTGYWEKRRKGHLARWGVEPLPSATNIMTYEDLEFLRVNKISGGFLPDAPGDGAAAAPQESSS